MPLCLFVACNNKKEDIKTVNNLTAKNFSNEIVIAISLDESRLYRSLVLISSIIKNANESTFYKIFALVPENFTKTNKEKIYSLSKLRENCSFEFMNMGYYSSNVFINYFKEINYYKLSLSNLLPKNIKKCLYLDSDEIVSCDLSELYNIDLTDFYFAGVLNFLEDDQRKSNHINSEVLLINLEKWRKDNIIDSFLLFVNNNLNASSEEILNSVCKNTLRLPFKYNVFACFDFKKVCENKSFEIFTEELKEGQYNFVILNFSLFPPWENLNANMSEKWWYYAKELKYWNEIENKYLVRK
jgi:lipopolysaccharide biosynthesis glycosyltransferase